MKPGHKTSEFLIVVAASVGAVCASAAGVFPGRYAALLTTVSAAAYAVSRGLTKNGGPGA